MRYVYGAIVLVLLAATAWLALSIWNSAGAGIGPAGFATYAKQGIRNENIKIYGGIQNDPWIVTCTDAPVYPPKPLSDTVTCHIHE